jgi:multidrug resistance protein MdtO
MAPPAAKARSPLFREIAEQLTKRSPERSEYALRVTVIVAATVAIAETYQTLDPSISAYLVFLLVKPDRVSSILLSLVFLALVTIIVALLLPISGALDNDPGLRLFAMAAASLTFVFLASASKLGGAGTMIAMLVVYIIALMPMSPVGELTTRGFLDAWQFVAIPVAMTIAVNLLIGPAPRRLLENLLAADLRTAALVFRDEPEARGALDARLRAHAANAPKLLKLAALEKTSNSRDLAALKQASLATFRILSIASAIEGDKKAQPPARLAARIAALLEDMAGIFDEGGYPADIVLVIEEGEEGVHKPLARKAVEDVKFALDIFTAHDPDATLTPPPPDPPPRKEGFFKADAFSNPVHSQFAAKTTLAALTCYWLYMILSWPGIHTCLLTCYLVAESTTAESLQRANLRIAGCLIGSALGLATIIMLFPWMTSIGSFLLLISGVTFIGTWIAAGGERIAYAGMQLVFAFYIATLQGYGPGFDLVEISDRVIGVLVGIAAGYIAFAYVWPNSLAQRIEANFQRLLLAFATLARASGRREQTAAAMEAQVLLDAVGKDLATVAYEPDSVRPDKPWLRAHRRALDDLSRLFGPLALRSLHRPAAAESFDARLTDIAAIAGAARRADRSGLAFAPVSGKALHHLNRLEKSLRALPPPEPQESDA